MKWKKNKRNIKKLVLFKCYLKFEINSHSKWNNIILYNTLLGWMYASWRKNLLKDSRKWFKLNVWIYYVHNLQFYASRPHTFSHSIYPSSLWLSIILGTIILLVLLWLIFRPFFYPRDPPHCHFNPISTTLVIFFSPTYSAINVTYFF